MGDAGLGTSAQLSDAQGVAIDRQGNVYIADPDNHRVRRLTVGGIIETIAGNGTPGFAGEGGLAQDAMLNAPYGVAVDGLGNVFIADLGNRRVRRVSIDGRITTVAGSGEAGSGGDGGSAAAAALTAPRNVAVDAVGRIYISDFEAHRVRRVTRDGIIEAVVGPGELSFPAGLAFDLTGYLHIADSGNNRVRRVDAAGSINTVVDELQTPTGLSFDVSGSLYIAETGGRRISVRSPGGSGRIVAGVGSESALRSLDTARDVAVDAGGNLYIADGRRVRRLSAGGEPSTLAGDGTFGYRGDGGAATDAVLNSPDGLAVGLDGSLYIADQRNHRVRRMSPDGVIVTVAGTGAPGFGQDGPTALTTPLNAPSGLFFDNSASLWVTEAEGNLVRRILSNGVMVTVAGGGSTNADPIGALLARLRSPSGVTTDNEGNLVFADTGNHRVRKMLPGGLLVSVAGTGSPGFSGDGIFAGAAQLNGPRGIAMDRAGNLFIADAGNNRIRRVGPDGRISTVAGEVTPLSEPHAVAVALDGSLFIADTRNHRIVARSATGEIRTVAGTSIAGFSGDGGPAREARFFLPAALALDGAGNLYIADQFNHRVRKLTPDASGLIDPIEEPAALNVFSGASLQPGPVAPGQIVLLRGENLAGPVEVLFDGKSAAVLRLRPNEIQLQAPYSIAERSRTEIEVRRDGLRRGLATVDVARAAPGLFSADGSGAGLVLASHLDGSAVTAVHPVTPGSLVTLYGTGEGQVRPPGAGGHLTPVLPVALSIGDQPAEILFAGSAPGFIGLLQVNARVPETLLPGNALVVLHIGSARSQEGVHIPIR